MPTMSKATHHIVGCSEPKCPKGHDNSSQNFIWQKILRYQTGNMNAELTASIWLGSDGHKTMPSLQNFIGCC